VEEAMIELRLDDDSTVVIAARACVIVVGRAA
jgi:hypothetical protein